MDIQKLLDECKKKLEADTDYKLAQKSGMSDARISDYRKGNRLPNSKDCFIIADILGMDAKKLIIQFERENAKSPKTKEFWEKQLERLGGVAASIFIAVTLIVTPTPSEAAPVAGLNKTTVYIMLNNSACK